MPAPVRRHITLFARVEKSALLGAIGLSTRVIAEQRDMGQLIAAVAQATRAHDPERRDEWNAAASHASAIQRHAFERIDRLRRDFLEVLDLDDYRVYSDTTALGGADGAWYRHDVIAAARDLRYFANLEAYRGWSRLKLVNIRAQLQDEIVVAVHGVGREFRGGVAAVALSIRREQGDESGLREIRCSVLTNEPFVLTYRESDPAVIARFGRWLEPALIGGIDRFRRAIADGA